MNLSLCIELFHLIQNFDATTFTRVVQTNHSVVHMKNWSSLDLVLLSLLLSRQKIKAKIEI